jgi:NTP pyrophosphatase (non-canonical NTP hydrolase)
MSEPDVTPLNYQQLAMRSLSPPEQYKPPPMDLFHALCGIMTESGELMDQLKQYCFYGKEYDRVNLKEEAGDLLWYIALLCQHLDCSLVDVMQMNINKLRTRYPEKFTTDGATIRDLRAERDTLEREEGTPVVMQTTVWVTYYETSVGAHNAYRTIIAFTSTTAITWFRLDTALSTCIDWGLTLDTIEPYIGASFSQTEARDVNGRRPRVWDLDKLEAGSVKLILPISR